MRPIIQYLNERFPIIPVLLYATGYAGYVTGLSFTANPWSSDPLKSFGIFLAITGIFIFILLRQRAIDEWRDFKHDAKNFPNRPLHRGLINPNQIAAIGLFAFISELLLVIKTGSITFYIPVIFFSFLMAKDFFIKSWLDRHFTSHFLLHEIFFIILGSYFLYTLSPASLSLNHWILALPVLVAAPMSVEIIRKFKPRHDPKGQPVKDTYSTVWGKNPTLLLLTGVGLISALSLSLLKNDNTFLMLGGLFALSFWVSRRHNNRIILLGAVQYLTLSFLANLSW